MYRFLYETQFLNLREQHKLHTFESKVSRKICGPKRDEVCGQLSILHNEEHHVRTVTSRSL